MGSSEVGTTRHPFPHVGRGGGRRLDRCVAGRRAAAFSFLRLRRHGALRHGSHAARDRRPAARCTEDGAGPRRRPRTRGAGRGLAAGHDGARGGRRTNSGRPDHRARTVGMRRVEPHRRSRSRAQNSRRHRAGRHDQLERRARGFRPAPGGGKLAAAHHPSYPRSAGSARALPDIHRPLRHDLHLDHPDRMHRDVFRLVARFRPAAVRGHGGNPQRFLPVYDTFGRGFTLRPRALRAIGNPFRHRRGCTARRSLPWRGPDRESRASRRGRPRQNGNSHLGPTHADRDRNGSGRRGETARSRACSRPAFRPSFVARHPPLGPATRRGGPRRAVPRNRSRPGSAGKVRRETMRARQPRLCRG